MLGNIWKRNRAAVVADKRLASHELSYKELTEGARRRLATINSEFRHTFKFLKKYPHSVTFFGSARFREDHPCYMRARGLAQRVVRETGYAVVTGGAGGVMEAANRGAYEAGGKSLGMNIVLPNEQKMNEYLTGHIRFYYFFIRKVALSFSAEVYIFFPGGYGTMDEFYEIVTLMQTKKIPKAPIICVGTEFWQKVFDFAVYMRDEWKTIDSGDENIFKVTDSDDEIIQIIKSAPLRKE